MGLFSKSVTQVGTAVSRVIEDAMVPDSIKNGTIKSMFEEGGGYQMMNFIMEDLTAGIGMRAERMYEYGRSGYVYGLPASNIAHSDDAKLLVKAAIEVEVSGLITIDYYHFGAFNNLHAGWNTLARNFGYNQLTNELVTLTASKGGLKCYLKDMVVFVADATALELGNTSLDQWGTPPNAGPVPGMKDLGAAGALKPMTPFTVVPGIPQDYVMVTYAWEEQIQELIGTATSHNAAGQAVISNVYAPKAVLKEASFNILLGAYNTEADWHQVKYTRGGSIGYWSYQAGTGTHPAIDVAFDKVHDNLGSFFPFAYFRFNKESAGLHPQSTEFKSSNKLVDYLNMDYKALVDGIHENPDIKDVEQAMMMLAVPADTTNPMEQRYLFDFFSRLYDTTSGNNTTDTIQAAATLDALGLGINEGNIIIQDKRFKMALGYRNLVKRKVTGTIGNINSYTSSYLKAVVSADYTTGVPCYSYRHQINETLYEEVLVYNLNMTYHIFEQYSAVGDENDKILLVPLDHAITRTYNIPDRELLYSRSLHYIFNSRVITKLKWYQTGIFQIIVVVVSIVATIITYGATWQALSASVVAGTLAIETLVMAFLIGLLKQVLVVFVIQLFVKAVGIKIAFIVAIISAIYSGYLALETESINGAPFAKELLSISAGLTDALGKELQDDFNDLLKERDEFNALVTREEQRLEDANKLLEYNNYLAPLIIFGESSKDFYQRTVHSGNIGVLSLDAISSFVDISLTLPKLIDTVG